MAARRTAAKGATGPGELPVEKVPLSRLKLDPKNARVHPSVNLAAVRASLERFGQRKPIVISKNRTVVAGNGTVEVARELGWTDIWATVFPGTPAEARAYAVADNRTSDLSSWDDQQLLDTLRDLDDTLLTAAGFDANELADLAASLDGSSPGQNDALAKRFGVPPFTVLDARSGAWRTRKQAWLALGIQSELGRASDLLKNGQNGGMEGINRQGRSKAASMPVGPGRGGMTDQLMSGRKVRSGAYGAQARTGADGKLVYETTTGATSIFDPVLCELVYRWYSAEGQHVLDPWAGGSVRGIVASRMGRNYLGVELRQEQVEANEAQRKLAGTGDVEWLPGDTAEVLAEAEAESYDLIFGCPPYYNLERYSDDPRDLSNMSVRDFDATLMRHVEVAAKALRPDAFAVFVVGNVRSPNGRLLDMRALMGRAGERAGLALYNDAVLLTAIGSLPVRAGKAFAASRVLGRGHQEVLVFLKGDRKRATSTLGEVELETHLAEVSPDLEAIP